MTPFDPEHWVSDAYAEFRAAEQTRARTLREQDRTPRKDGGMRKLTEYRLRARAWAKTHEVGLGVIAAAVMAFAYGMIVGAALVAHEVLVRCY